MGAGDFECIWVRIFVRLRNRYNNLGRTSFEIYIYTYKYIYIYIYLVACLYPGRIVCMFSLNKSVKGRSRKISSGTSWLKQLGPVPRLTTRSLRDLGQSHLKMLRASVSLSVTGGYALPPRGVVRLAADQPSTGRSPTNHTHRCRQKHGLVCFPKPFPALLVLWRAKVQVLGVQGRIGKLNLHIV